MKNISNEKAEKDALGEVPSFSDLDPVEYPERKEDYREGVDKPTEMESSSRILGFLRGQEGVNRSLLLIGLLCVFFGVVLFVLISVMKPAVKRPQIVGQRVRLPISSIEKEEEPTIPELVEQEGLLEGGIPSKEEPIDSEQEPSTMIRESGVGNEVFTPAERELPKEEKEVTVAEVEGERPETTAKEEGKTQHAMVEEPKGQAKPERRLPKGRYTVNIASFRDKGNADRVMRELEEKGYEAFVEKAVIPRKGTWYRVAVGRFSSQGEALAFARGLKEKGINYSFVRKLREAQ